MNNRTFVLLLLLMAPFATRAETMTSIEYDAAQEQIETDYASAMAACDKLIDNTHDNDIVGRTADADSTKMAEIAFQGSPNAKGLCTEDAAGKRNVALAELEYRRSGAQDDRAKLEVAKADAAYDVAKQKCDVMSPNANSTCVEAAKAEAARAKAEARQ
jgi:hypothetical protein